MTKISIRIIKDLIGREMFKTLALKNKSEDDEEKEHLRLYIDDLKKAEIELEDVARKID
jgi:hypothetical protein